MKINLPHPANWQDFEDLCFHLWKSIWGDYASHPNGRRGQRQNGVDIYGRPAFNELYTGVQCKGKNENYGKELTIEEIDTECKNAMGFKPELNTFILATTSPRDEKIQEHCREINTPSKYGFEVDSWSWDDIEDEVQCRPDVMEIFYPNVKYGELVNEIKLSRITSSNKLHAFFSRPGLLDYLNRFNVDMLDNITYELATNAFEHGKATYFNITIDGRKIIYKDNGLEFNPITLLETEINRGGSVTLKYAKDVFSLNYRYESENIFELTYIGNDAAGEKEEIYSINLNVQDVFGRSQTQDLAFREISKIPGNVGYIVIDICGKMNPAISIVLGFFDILKKLINTNQIVRIYLPNGLYYYDELVERYKEESRFEFIMKN